MLKPKSNAKLSKRVVAVASTRCFVLFVYDLVSLLANDVHVLNKNDDNVDLGDERRL